MTHGGGEALIRVLVDKVRDKRVTVAILDSDRKTPLDPLPPKLSTARQTVEGEGWPVAEIVCLPCREIENLVPLHIIEQLPCAQTRATDITAFKKIAVKEAEAHVAEAERLHQFFDLKNGPEQEPGEWLKAKLTLGGKMDVRGFGSNLISQLNASSELSHKFRLEVRSERWWALFGDTFERALWMVVAARPQFV